MCELIPDPADGEIMRKCGLKMLKDLKRLKPVDGETVPYIQKLEYDAETNEEENTYATDERLTHPCSFRSYISYIPSTVLEGRKPTTEDDLDIFDWALSYLCLRGDHEISEESIRDIWEALSDHKPLSPTQVRWALDFFEIWIPSALEHHQMKMEVL